MKAGPKNKKRVYAILGIFFMLLSFGILGGWIIIPNNIPQHQVAPALEVVSEATPKETRNINPPIFEIRLEDYEDTLSGGLEETAVEIIQDSDLQIGGNDIIQVENNIQSEVNASEQNLENNISVEEVQINQFELLVTCLVEWSNEYYSAQFLQPTQEPLPSFDDLKLQGANRCLSEDQKIKYSDLVDTISTEQMMEWFEEFTLDKKIDRSEIVSALDEIGVNGETFE